MREPRSDRVGKRVVMSHVDQDIHRDLKVLAARLGVTMDLILHFSYARTLEIYNEALPETLREKLRAELAKIVRDRRSPPD